jgi:6-phosphogluconolactonase
VLYAAEYSRRGRLSCVPLDQGGQPGPLSTVGTLGDLPIAVTVHPAGNYAYVAHFGDGTITAVALDAQGLPAGAEVIVRGDGRPDRPNFSRLHQVRSAPTGTAILVTDIGRDEVVAYAADGDGHLGSDPVARISFPERSGPRHIEFHPSGRYVYVVSERASCVYVVRSEGGIPTEVMRIYSTVPPDYHGNNRPSELKLHPDGRCLYVGNRGFDSITMFAVGEDGTLDLLGYQPSFGGNLSCLTVDPMGRYLIAGNVVPGTLVVFRVTAGGRLEQAGEAVEAPAPRSFVFAEFGGDTGT